MRERIGFCQGRHHSQRGAMVMVEKKKWDLGSTPLSKKLLEGHQNWSGIVQEHSRSTSPLETWAILAFGWLRLRKGFYVEAETQLSDCLITAVLVVLSASLIISRSPERTSSRQHNFKNTYVTSNPSDWTSHAPPLGVTEEEHHIKQGHQGAPWRVSHVCVCVCVCACHMPDIGMMRCLLQIGSPLDIDIKQTSPWSLDECWMPGI